VTGANVQFTVNGAPAPLWETIVIAPGDVVRMAAAKSGVRAYIAFSGGIDVPPVLGSRSTYLRGRIGGLEGRALTRGDTLALGEAALPEARRVTPASRPSYPEEVTVHVVLGPQHTRFTEAGLATLLGRAYEVTPQSDRMGTRLRGPRVEHSTGHDTISDGMPLGGIQIPGDGQPIVLLLDRQSAGGYPKPAAVCSFDIGRFTQVTPGHRIRFTAISTDEAHDRRAAWLAALSTALEPVG
jgi:antagonist of KipI